MTGRSTMGLVKTEGLVLRETKYGEHDKMLTVFTKDWGPVSVSARGVRGGKRRCTGAGLFCYSKFVLFQGRGPYHLNECELIHSFHRLGDDLTRMSAAAYFCETAEREQMENLPLLRLLLNSLSLLERGDRPVWQIKGVYELTAAAAFGFAPVLSSCVRCGKQTALNRFSCQEGGVLCDSCGAGRKRVSGAVFHAMAFVQQSTNPFAFQLAEEYREEFSSLCQKFFLYYLGKRPKSLDFLEELLSFEKNA